VQIGIERGDFFVAELLGKIGVRPEALARPKARRAGVVHRRSSFVHLQR
jgi:hypothetical protein